MAPRPGTVAAARGDGGGGVRHERIA
ncbi:MAG: hypothetical protein QOJ27_317, partial [Sphingomonadales bacterium]|nr:hypothetical protein [Sphingomonadales bacterium]